MFALISRSSAYNSSQGVPVRNSQDKASSTMTNKRGLYRTLVNSNFDSKFTHHNGFWLYLPMFLFVLYFLFIDFLCVCVSVWTSSCVIIACLCVSVCAVCMAVCLCVCVCLCVVNAKINTYLTFEYPRNNISQNCTKFNNNFTSTLTALLQLV